MSFCRYCNYPAMNGSPFCGGAHCLKVVHRGMPDNPPKLCMTPGCRNSPHSGFQHCSRQCALSTRTGQPQQQWQQQWQPQQQQQQPPQPQSRLCAKPGCARPVFGPYPHCGKSCYAEQQQSVCKNQGCLNSPFQSYPYCGKGCAPGGHRHKGDK